MFRVYIDESNMSNIRGTSNTSSGVYFINNDYNNFTPPFFSVLFKIDSVGNYQWKKFYGTMPCSSNMIWDMEPIGDGTYICCGVGTYSTEVRTAESVTD